jgi:hypothetical protein
LRKPPNLGGNPKKSLFRRRRRKVDRLKRSEPSTDSLNLLGGESRGEAHQVHFRASLKRDPTKTEIFLTLMKILQSSHLTKIFLESVYNRLTKLSNSVLISRGRAVLGMRDIAEGIIFSPDHSSRSAWRRTGCGSQTSPINELPIKHSVTDIKDSPHKSDRRASSCVEKLHCAVNGSKSVQLMEGAEVGC